MPAAPPAIHTPPAPLDPPAAPGAVFAVPGEPTAPGGVYAPPVAPVAVAASGTITFTGEPADTQTLTIGGVEYKFYYGLGPYNMREIPRPGSPSPTSWAAATAARINAWTFGGADVNVTAAAVAGVVTLTARAAGVAGNAITLTETAANVAVSGANLTGGVDGLRSPAILYTTPPALDPPAAPGAVFALPGAPSAPGGVFAPPAATTPLPPVPIFGMPLHGLYNSDHAAVRNTDGQVLETIPTV